MRLKIPNSKYRPQNKDANDAKDFVGLESSTQKVGKKILYEMKNMIK